jgi:hypothetical protein
MGPGYWAPKRCRERERCVRDGIETDYSQHFRNPLPREYSIRHTAVGIQNKCKGGWIGGEIWRTMEVRKGLSKFTSIPVETED